jgi:electron transfer flavoprotein alpha subunit/NAD-dependent dihydropyrimidine dehydrogenase PreA subunit
VSISIKKTKCTACGLCVKQCPYAAVRIEDDMAVISHEVCTLCGACVEACRPGAIVVKRRKRNASRNLDAYRGIAVIAQTSRGGIHPVTYEMIGAAARLAGDLGEKVTAFLLGGQVRRLCSHLVEYGADTVVFVEDKRLSSFNDELHARVLTRLIGKYRPEIVIAGATAVGRGLAPRIAVALRTGLTADCTGLSIDPKTRELIQTRPAFGGNIMADIRCSGTRPQMATVRPGVMEKNTIDESRSGNLIEEKPSFPADRMRMSVLEVIDDEASEPDISGADVVIAGGRGVRRPEGFSMLEELAGLLNGTVGASRAAVDAGWIGRSRQVGQTGKTVRPKVYMACGISGAVQHLAGMKGAKVIVAINKDRDAPIFRVADYGFVGDVGEVVPALVRKLKKERGVGETEL